MRPSEAPHQHDSLRQGRVVASHGRHCMVESSEGERRLCHSRGKKNSPVVGDLVRWQPSEDEGIIERIEPRKNLFFRQDEVRSKSFAANLDQILIVLAAEPEFSEHQLARALIAARSADIPAFIALNKQDVAAAFDRAWTRLTPYRQMAVDVLPLSLKTNPGGARDLLAPRLANASTLVLGPSGVGKSTLVNLMVPGAAAATAEISQALNSGKHTTTSTTWYWIDPARTTAVIDSPGFQGFGLQHIEATQLASLMPDIAAQAGDCRFYNCTHLHEPDCSVRAHVATGLEEQAISGSRYRIYCDLFAELSQERHR